MSANQLLTLLQSLLESDQVNSEEALSVLSELRSEVAGLESNLESAQGRVSYLEYDLRCAENA
jgi:hypothetical protein